MTAALALAAALGLAAGAARAEPPAAAACTPRTLDRHGVRFVEVCGAGVLLAEAPLPCAPGEGAACEPIVALAPAPHEAARPNRPADALLASGEAARRLCRERFAGRLPTPAERERARSLGFVTVQVSEEPGEFARLRLEERPEWVADGDRLAQAPARAAAAAGGALLACVAEPALPRARAVALGAVCDERPSEGHLRSPDCALAAPNGSRFEIGCDPAPVARSGAGAAEAAVRCVLQDGAE